MSEFLQGLSLTLSCGALIAVVTLGYLALRKARR